MPRSLARRHRDMLVWTQYNVKLHECGIGFQRMCCYGGRAWFSTIRWPRLSGAGYPSRPWRSEAGFRTSQDVPKLPTQAEGLIRDLIERTGGAEVVNAALYRKNDQVCRNAKTTPYALQAWCWRILATANKNPPKVSYESGTVTLDFLK